MQNTRREQKEPVLEEAEGRWMLPQQPSNATGKYGSFLTGCFYLLADLVLVLCCLVCLFVWVFFGLVWVFGWLVDFF